jgi:hypothetical protein
MVLGAIWRSPKTQRYQVMAVFVCEVGDQKMVASGHVSSAVPYSHMHLANIFPRNFKPKPHIRMSRLPSKTHPQPSSTSPSQFDKPP